MMKKKITLIQMNLEKLAEDKMKETLAGQMFCQCKCRYCHCVCYCKAELGEQRWQGATYPGYTDTSMDNDMDMWSTDYIFPR